MADDIKIRVDNIKIRFNIASESVDNLKEYVIKMLKRELRFKEFLALDGINLTLKRGESLGIIGRNGAGKSTLLKAICGILKPSEGSVFIDGRISPLIELGAGFDVRLTAKENIYLNGAVLGYSEKFIEEHFEEIVEFAEVGEFLNVPIKNYSSGMKSKLGFAIATMVHPDILIVDEILSVGDFKFKEKCEKRMKELLSGGTTLLFVSHSMPQVKRLCQRALWLEKGKIKMEGPSEEVCSAYEKS
ncbi:MAG: ABC transporter ATP-binding protein [Treponema sp.]|nr:ABC transporter ATP-binding protein [Treponema sp.]